MLPAVSAVFQSTDHAEEQLDLPAGHCFPGRKPPVYQSAPRRWQQKVGGLCSRFWHCECICGLSEKAFTAKYHKWCRKHGYNFSEGKALDIYTSACGHFGVIPKTDTAKLLVENRPFSKSGQLLPH